MPSYGRIDPEYAGHLASCPEEQDGPISMVNSMKYRTRAAYGDGGDEGVTGKEADDRYAPLDILADIGALVVFFGDVEPGGEWDRVGIVRYPTRRSFIAMQSRSDFQDRHVHKAAGMDRTIVCGTLPIGVRAPARGGSRVVFELTAEGTPLQIADAGRLRVARAPSSATGASSRCSASRGWATTSLRPRRPTVGWSRSCVRPSTAWRRSSG